MQIWPGQPYPLGATFDGVGTNFSLFSEVATRVELCLFDEAGQRDPRRPAGNHRALLAWIPSQREAGPTLRFPRARTVGARARAVVQPREAAARSVREGRRRHVGVERSGVPLPLQRARKLAQRARQRPVRRQERRHQPLLRLGLRSAPEHAVAPHGRLRDARQGIHQAASRDSRRPARHLRRHGASGRRQIPAAAWHHRRGIAAGAPVRAGLAARRTRACATTGATTRSAISRRTTNTRRAARAASRCRSSSISSRRCTRPASR